MKIDRIYIVNDTVVNNAQFSACLEMDKFNLGVAMWDDCPATNTITYIDPRFVRMKVSDGIISHVIMKDGKVLGEYKNMKHD